jgi:succinoglycan biosynthesis transport protein ExoP
MRADYDRSEDAGVSGEINLSDIMGALSRKRWWVIVPTLAAFVCAFVFVNVVKPRYTAEARVLLENQENYLTRVGKGERAEAVEPDPEAVQSQIQLVTSRDLARRVIKTLHLQGNPEFDPLAEGVSPLTRFLVLLGVMRDPTRLPPEERILESYFNRLAVYSPTKTRVLLIEFTSRDPDLAARAANVIANEYIDMQQEAKREQAHVVAESLGKLISALQTRVGEAESRAEAFRSKMGLFVGSNNATIATQQLGDLNKELSTSRVAQADAQAKAKLLLDMLGRNRVGEIPDVANNELIRRIAEQRVSVTARLALESRTLLPGHPRIKELRAELAMLDAEWRREAKRTARTLENDARIAGSRVENLERALEEQKKVAGTAGADEVRLRELERVARLLREQLESDTARYQEALARETIKASPADARIVQRALAPQYPSFPKKLAITAFATLAALVLSAGSIVAGELLSDRPRSSRPLGPASPPATAGGTAPEQGGEQPRPLREAFASSPPDAPTIVTPAAAIKSGDEPPTAAKDAGNAGGKDQPAEPHGSPLPAIKL